MQNLADSLKKVNQKTNAEKKNGTKRLVGGHFNPDVLKQIRMIAAAEDTKIHLILAEAFNDLFEKYGYPRIAE